MAKLYTATGEQLIDLGSDQTSLHNPFNGGYYPVQVFTLRLLTFLLPQLYSSLVHLMISEFRGGEKCLFLSRHDETM